MFRNAPAVSEEGAWGGPFTRDRQGRHLLSLTSPLVNGGLSRRTSVSSVSDEARDEAALALLEAECNALVDKWDDLWWGSLPGAKQNSSRTAYEHLYGRAPLTSPGEHMVQPLCQFRSNLSMSPPESFLLQPDDPETPAANVADASDVSFRFPGMTGTALADSPRLSTSYVGRVADERVSGASALSDNSQLFGRETENTEWRHHIFYASLSQPAAPDDPSKAAVTPASDTGLLSLGANSISASQLPRSPSTAGGPSTHATTSSGTNGLRPLAPAAPAPADAAGGGGTPPAVGALERHLSTGSDSDDRARGVAWRYRFAKRWQAEQQRMPNPDSVIVDPGNDMLGSFGEGLQLQLDLRAAARQGSMGRSGSELMSDCLMFEDGMTTVSSANNSVNGGLAMATQELVARAAHANQMRAQQKHLEDRADARWRGANQHWVGSDIPPVTIDKVGEFNYVLFKLSDIKGRHQYCVRGGSRSTMARISEKLNLEVSELCYLRKLKQATIQPLGYGRMQWRRDKDRHLVLLSDGVHVHDERYQVPEFLTLAAAITKAGLPSTYKVSVQ